MSAALRFGRVELRTAERQLLIDGQPAAIGARAFDVLNLLIALRERVVTKDELLAAAWPGLVVEENNLQVQISTLRKLLGAGVITTVPGQGYQFTATLDGERGADAIATTATPAGVVGSMPPQGSRAKVPARRIAAAIALLALIAIAVTVWSNRQARPAPVRDAGPAAGAAPVVERSIAVLPFVDLSEKKDQEYFSDGLSESLIDLLTQIPDLRVPARTSCFYFKGRAEDITEIARKLRVAHVLEGSVRKSGNTIRVTAQLIRADSGYHIWSETFERNLTDIFKVQDEIANAVVGALRLTMLNGSGSLEAAPVDIDAYTLLLQGRFAAAKSTAADMRRAVELFEQSVKIDPNYAAAWAAAASARRWLADYVDPTPDENVGRARAAANRALSLNPKSVEAHLVLATIYQNYDFNRKAAASEIDMAGRIEPGNVLVARARAFRAFSGGDTPAAVNLYTAVIDRDPFDAGTYRQLALTLAGHGDLAEAESAMRRGLELSPRLESGHFTLARILVMQHAYADAVAAASQEPDSLYRRTALAIAYQMAGRGSESRAQLDQLIARDAGGAAYQIAEVQAVRGDREAALQWLRRAYRQHDSGLQGMKTDSFLRSLADDPGFRDLEAKLGLAG